MTTLSCPVCGANLSDFQSAIEQEAHVKSCLEGGAGAESVSQPAKYLVYRLPGESLLVGTECEDHPPLFYLRNTNVLSRRYLSRGIH